MEDDDALAKFVQEIQTGLGPLQSHLDSLQADLKARPGRVGAAAECFGDHLLGCAKHFRIARQTVVCVSTATLRDARKECVTHF